MPTGSSVRDLLAALANDTRSFRRFVYDPESDTVSGDVVVVLNERLVDLAGGIDTELLDGDRLAILQALAGG